MYKFLFLLLPIFSWSYLFNYGDSSTDSNPTDLLNQEKIALYHARSDIVRDYSKCMISSDSNEERKECSKERNLKNKENKKQFKAIYKKQKDQRLSKMKSSQEDFVKNSKIKSTKPHTKNEGINYDN